MATSKPTPLACRKTETRQLLHRPRLPRELGDSHLSSTFSRHRKEVSPISHLATPRHNRGYQTADPLKHIYPIEGPSKSPP